MTLYLDLPSDRVGHNSPWVGQVIVEEDSTVTSVQVGYLDAVIARVSPVDVTAQPIHSHTLRATQTWIGDNQLE